MFYRITTSRKQFGSEFKILSGLTAPESAPENFQILLEQLIVIPAKAGLQPRKSGFPPSH